MARYRYGWQAAHQRRMERTMARRAARVAAYTQQAPERQTELALEQPRQLQMVQQAPAEERRTAALVPAVPRSAQERTDGRLQPTCIVPASPPTASSPAPVPPHLQHVPAIFAGSRAASTSDRFQFIDTAQIVQALCNEGFVPVRAQQTRTRLPDRQRFARHMVVFRLPDAPALRKRGDVAPEIVLFNAHDGTSAYRLHAGLFRMICSNGLIVAEGTVAGLRVRHVGQRTVEQVVAGTQTLVQALPGVLDQIDTWKATTLSDHQRLSYALDVLTLRYGAVEKAPISPTQVLQPRRQADQSPDLFTTFNVVQENLLRGGLVGQRPDGRRTTTRRLNAIDTTTQINLALWDLTSQFSYSLN